MRIVLLIVVIILLVTLISLAIYFHMEKPAQIISEPEQEPTIEVSTKVITFSPEVKYRIVENQGVYRIRRWCLTEWREYTFDYDSLAEARDFVNIRKANDIKEQQLDKGEWKIVEEQK